MTDDLARPPRHQPDITDTAFESLAEILYTGHDFDAIYAAICSAATDLVTGCDHASLMLTRHGKALTAAASDEVASRIDAFEREIGDGPCLDAIEDAAAYVDSDLTDGSPWPELTRRVLAETPVRGMAGFRLINADGKAGALNLFSDEPGALTHQSVDQAALLVSFASVALLAAAEKHNAETLRAGLESNREIGKAIGLLMAFHQVDDQAAFTILRRTSQDMNLKLAEVAREIVSHQNSRRVEPS
ncbi:MAG: GAF and ANTAR domain-containing protein [Nocardioidaceae bacterium]